MKLRMELSSSPDSRTLANAWSWALLFEPECQFVAVQAIVGIVNCLPFLLHYILNSLQLHIYCNWAMTSPNDIRLYQVHVHFNHCTSDLKHKKGKNLDCNKKTNLLSKFGSFISVMFFFLLSGALDEKQLIDQLWVLGLGLPSPTIEFLFLKYLNICRDLGSLQEREICCYSISCKDKTNIGKIAPDYCIVYFKGSFFPLFIFHLSPPGDHPTILGIIIKRYHPAMANQSFSLWHALNQSFIKQFLTS